MTKHSLDLEALVWIGAGIVVTLFLITALLVGAWLVWGRSGWHGSMMGGWDWRRGTDSTGCPVAGEARDDATAGERALCLGTDLDGDGATPADDITIEQAEAAFREYLERLPYDDLVLSEVMEFEHNFYAIATEAETGTGAMELLLDKQSGTVSPEVGPNMMWNAKYGMHGRGGGMMSGFGDLDHDLTAHEAVETAQAWLDANRPGVTVEEHTDAFYGYYTLHTLEDGEIEGMLSVHGDTGQVWYHTWHGGFVQMAELEGHASEAAH